jgi:hypothetical protein
MKYLVKENLIINITVFCFFLFFVFTWLADAGASGYGLYSEVDGQLFAWIGSFFLKWGKPFDMNTLNPFAGMGSVVIPVNSWWNPGALALGFSSNKLTSFVLSYSIYWVEIFFSIYFLAITIGLNKVESILASELYVLFLFPPFSAYFGITPIYSLAPLVAHVLALFCMMTITYMKLGEDGIAKNLFLAFSFLFFCSLIIISAGFGFIPAVPIYAFILMGCTLQNLNRQQLLWRIGTITFAAGFFLILHGLLYFEGLMGYMSSSIGDIKKIAISFAIPKVWQKHTSIFYGFSSLISYFHIFALLGGIVGVLSKNGKYRWIAFGFILAILFPDIFGFLTENGIIASNMNRIGISHYMLDAYPLYCIFFVVFISFVWRMIARILFARNILENDRFFYFGLVKYLKLLTPLILLPAAAMTIWSHHLSERRISFSEPSKTPIVSYLENKIGLKSDTHFKGSAAQYFESVNSPLRLIDYRLDSKGGDSYFSADHYITAREFLKIHFQNRHMFSDLWNYHIPTIEDYAHTISKTMYIFFQNMLADEGDFAHPLFLNVYKLNLQALRAMGVRFLITDKIIHDKNLSLVMTENQKLNKESNLNFNLTIAAKKIIEEQLIAMHKSDTVSLTSFMNEFKDKFDKIYPAQQAEKDKVINALNTVITTRNHHGMNWSYSELYDAKNIFNSLIFSWVVSPPIYLYEIKNPNLATFSPTHIYEIHSGKKLILQMAAPSFSFEESAIVQESIPSNISHQLVKVQNSKMSFGRNVVHIQSESRGWSILLLPLQYSHCFQITEMTSDSAGQASPRVLRANLIHTALLFKEKLNVKLNFNFGIGKSADCRTKDIQDLQALGLLDERYLIELQRRAIKQIRS